MIDFRYEELGQDGELLTVHIDGELDTASCDYFFSCIEGQIKRGHSKIVIDCRNLRFISSMGLAMMLRVHARMKKSGGNVKLAQVEGTVAEVVKLVKLDKLMNMYPTVENALDSFSSD